MSTPTIDFAMIEMLRGLRGENEPDPRIELAEALEKADLGAINDAQVHELQQEFE